MTILFVNDMAKRLTVISLCILLVFYLFTRLFRLTLLPIFTDESIYIYWAKVILTSHGHWFISLTDGKPPLLEWVIAILLLIFPHGWYLIAGRLASVLMGGVSVIALYFLSMALFKNRAIAFLSVGLYIIFPFTLLYDRLALFDSPLQAMLLVSAFFAVRTGQTRELRNAVLLGISLGLSFLFKPTALLFFVLLPLVILLISYGDIKKYWRVIVRNISVAMIISEGINNLQRVSRVYHLMGIKDAQFQQPLSELLKNPFALTVGNLQGLFSWIVGYYTWPFFLFGLVAFIYLLVISWRKGLMLFVLWFVPIFGFATVGREIFPRYILFISPYFLLALSAFLVALYKYLGRYGVVSIVVAVVLVIPLIRTDFFLLTNPPLADIPTADSGQLITSQSSGYGIPEVFDYLDQQLAKGRHLYLVTQGTFGDYPYAFSLEYWGDSNMTIIPVWPLDNLDPQIVNLYREHKDVFILLKEHDTVPTNLPLNVVMKVNKPGGGAPIFLTKIKKGYFE